MTYSITVLKLSPQTCIAPFQCDTHLWFLRVQMYVALKLFHTLGLDMLLCKKTLRASLSTFLQKYILADPM